MHLSWSWGEVVMVQHPGSSTRSSVRSKDQMVSHSSVLVSTLFDVPVLLPVSGRVA
jgi:hypothetical protein